MKTTQYPLGHTFKEIERLEKQAILLHDHRLDELASQFNSCLEIGCGAGANLPLLRKINPDLHYTGIDISQKAIDIAKYTYQHDKNATFLVMDALNMQFDTTFDLIFTKLVLWSIGTKWPLVLKAAHNLLNHHGAFYALEPCNQLIQFYPPKPLLSKWMQIWDQAIKHQHLNSYIGTDIEQQFILNGYKQVIAHFFPISSLGQNKQQYAAIVDNFKGFYMGDAMTHLGLNQTYECLINDAINELEDYTDTSFVMDALYVTIGYKS